MTPTTFFNLVLAPSSQRFGAMQYRVANNQASRVLMMTIAGIESAWSNRIQQPNGPARSYWQIEAEGALRDVQSNADTAQWLTEAADLWDVDADNVFDAIAYHDSLAYVVGRLALWLDPAPLPLVGDTAGAWAYYLRNWRPGVPRPDAWAPLYAQALQVVK